MNVQQPATRPAFDGPRPGDPPAAPATRSRGLIIDRFVERRLMTPERSPPRGPLPAPEARWRYLPATTPEAHLTAMDALRIDDPRRLTVGDWHKSAHWHFVITHEWPQEIAPTALECPHMRKVLEVLGTDRVIDVHAKFVAMGHPDAARHNTIWASAHERAVVEHTWRLVQQCGHISERAFPLRELCRWVTSGPARHWCFDALDRMGEDLTGRKASDWTRWVQRWRIADRLTDDDTPETLSPFAADVLNELEAY